MNTLTLDACVCLNWSVCVCICVGLCFTFQNEVTDKLRFTTFYFYFGLVVCELILCCFNEKPPLFSNVDTDPVSQKCCCRGHVSQKYLVFWVVGSECVLCGCIMLVKASLLSTPHPHMYTDLASCLQKYVPLALFNLCGLFFCIFFDTFSESLPWRYSRFSLHNYVLVVHKVGLHRSLPQTHKLVNVWWFAWVELRHQIITV